jgi:hypothetical protein
VPTEEGQDATAVALGAHGDEGIGRAEWQIVIASNQLSDAPDIALAATELETACLEVGQDTFDDAPSVAPLC